MPKQEQYNPQLHLERKQAFQEETRAESADQTFVMSFCPKCEALLELVRGKSTEIYCRKCKYRAKLERNRVLGTKIDVPDSARREIAVLDLKDSTLRTFPAVHAICSECNNDTSETWTMAIGSEGTGGVTFLRCTACGHTRREAE